MLIFSSLLLSCPKIDIKPDVINTQSKKNLRLDYLYELSGHTQYIFYSAFSPDSKYLASGGADRCVIIWDLKNTNQIKCIKEEYDEIWGIPLQYSKDGQYLVIGSFETLKVLSVKDDYKILSAKFAHPKGIQTLAISPDNKYVATGGVDGRIIVWSLPDLSKIKEIQAHASEIWNLKISPDEKYLISGGEDTLAKQWSFPDLSLIQILRYHSMPIEFVDISKDGSKLLLGSADSTVSVWNTRNLSSPVTILKGHIGSVLVAVFSIDGKYVFSGGDDDELYVCDAENGEVKERFQAHFGDVMTIAVSDDGRYIVSGSRDRRLKIWAIRYE